MRRRFPLSIMICAVLILPLLLVPACSDDDRSTKPTDTGARHLAGGGRDQGGDPFAGGPDGSGPTRPDFEYPNPGYVPLFYSEIDCRQSPSQGVILNQEDWQSWWTAETACLGSGTGEPGGGGDPTQPPHERMRSTDRWARRDLAVIDRLRSVAHHAARGIGKDGDPTGVAWGDSGVVDPDSVSPYPAEAPPVDFEKNVVLTISLAPEAGFGRGVWVTEVIDSVTGATIKFQVSKLGDDCFAVSDSLGEVPMSTPTIAVLVPRPVTLPVAWERTDVVFDCSWEPDPTLPLTLYYTDADCDLGAGEVVIRDHDRFDAWLGEALACDQTRWYDGDSTITPAGGTGPKFAGRFAAGDRDSVPVDPAPPPPGWIGIDVDFTTHAVLILRAGIQTRWGGGIWLDAISVTPAGTVIDYTVMEPSGDCPGAGGDPGLLRPTVAIRVPLPLTEPVTWNRRTDSIECGWTGGGPGTGTGTDSVPAPRPH